MKKLCILNKKDIDWTIEHLSIYGDTDIFPVLIEYDFLLEAKTKVIEAIQGADITQYKPMSLIDVVVPKSKFGFRPAHLMYPYDALLFTTAIVTIGEELEKRREQVAPNRSYSYRFIQCENYRFFDNEKSYKEWLIAQRISYIFNESPSHVIVTDVSDFYQRIYHHRIENLLSDYCSNKPIQKLILSFLKSWRARQSFGLPVGGNGARVLAELALLDTDRLLLDHGINATRYVDDFAIFVEKNQNAYSILSMLAAHLISNEGLALSAQKTKILEWDEYHKALNFESGEDIDSAEDAGIFRLYWMAYGKDDVDPEALAELQALDLKRELEEELAAEYWNIGKIRIILRALRLTGSTQASVFIRDNFKRLLPFAKEVIWLMSDLKKAGDNTFESMSGEVIDLLVSEDLQPLAATRSWLLESFVKGILPITRQQLSKLGILNGTLDLRQIYRIRSALGDVNFFRQNKTRVHELNSWLQPGFLHGASCLPADEYKTWISTVKSQLNFPLSNEFCDWCLNNRK